MSRDVPLLPLYASMAWTGTTLPVYEINSSIPLYKNYNHISQDEEIVKFDGFLLWIALQSVTAVNDSYGILISPVSVNFVLQTAA